MSSLALRQASRGYSRKAMELSAEGALFQPEERVAERYVVRSLLGEGAAGFSYQAYDEALKTEVCLKVIHPHLLQTPEEKTHFDIVLKQMGRLLHPSLSRVLDVGTAKGRMFYTQQFIEGLSLRRIIDERLLKGSLFSCKELEPILVQLMHALEAVHQKGAHLNLKPGNIFVLPDLLRLTDVGLGLAIPRVPFVHAHRVRREDSYFAPEFLSGMEASGSADVYSLGVIMGEMLAGLLPDGALPSLRKNNPELPEELETIYRKAIAASPFVRYRSLQAFQKDFCAFYERHAQREEPKAPAPVLPPKVESILAMKEAAPDALAPREQLSSLELRDLLPRRTVRLIQWSAILAGVLVAIGVLVFLLSSKEEERTGRNVEGFIQKAPPAAKGAAKGARGVAKVLPPKAAPAHFHTEEVALPEVSPAPPSETPEVQRVVAKAPVAVAEASRCPEHMLRIPAGSFKMGTEREDPYLSFEDLPASSREGGSFCIDTHEYPNRPGQLPMVNVAWAKAQELCQSQGKRLCTEAEWEKACRGSQGLRWPYGNAFADGTCNTASEAGTPGVLAALGRFPRCRSPYGALDMSGNAAEWTAEKVAKGGSFASSDAGVRCAARNLRAAASPETGFRCCANLR